MSPPPPLFPVARWVALVFLLVWAPAYAVTWGWRNFFLLCDVTLFLTVVGLWRGSALLLGSQAIASVVVNAIWAIDVVGRLLLGRHLIGGTEYMWNASAPLFVRMLSLFHAALPFIHVWAIRRTGYDRRAFRFAAVELALVFTGAFLVALPNTNPNFVFREPFTRNTVGPPVVHLVLSILFFIYVVIWPTHLAFARWVGRRNARQ